MEYKIEKDSKEYELLISEMPECLMDRSFLSNDNLNGIDDICREIVNKRLDFLKGTKEDYNYEIVSTYVSIGRVEDYDTFPMDIKLGCQTYFNGESLSVANNRVIFVYKSESNSFYAVSAHPIFLNGQLVADRCSVLTDTAGLLMSYNSEQEAEAGIKNWLSRMAVGYQEGDFLKIDNPTK